MEFERGPLPGCWFVRLKKLQDARGSFVKTFEQRRFSTAGLTVQMAEEFYSISHRGVIRGMHFQVPPFDHDKIVYCAQGCVEDVLLDLRPGPTYGQSRSVTLSQDNPIALFLPKGIAHGFEALEDDSLMVYKTSTAYSPQHDRGLRWNSFGHAWKTNAPQISDRDQQHPEFSTFVSPFPPFSEPSE